MDAQNPANLLVDGQHLYFLTAGPYPGSGGALTRANLDGTSAVTFGGGVHSNVILDDTDIYWTEGGGGEGGAPGGSSVTLFKAPKSDPRARQSLATWIGSFAEIAINTDLVFVSIDSLATDSAIDKVPKTGGALTQIHVPAKHRQCGQMIKICTGRRRLQARSGECPSTAPRPRK